MVARLQIVYTPVMGSPANPLSIALSADRAVYLATGGELQLDVRVDSETVWLTQEQIAKLFDVGRTVVTKHIANIYGEGELERRATSAKFALVRQEGRRTIRREIEHYALDTIISVGYRVNSKTATAFRQWATRLIRERLIAAHRQRQRAQGRLDTLGAIAANVATDEEARALLSIVSRFEKSWRVLRQFDEDQLPEQPVTPTKRIKRLTLKQAQAAVATLKADLLARGEASDLFGLERGDGLAGILGNIEQTFDGKPLYPSVEARAAALLYFVIKDHPFTDGNKRIGSLLFVHYLDKNSRLSKDDGTMLVDNNALVALALLIAKSDPKQRDLVIRLILAMLSQ